MFTSVVTALALAASVSRVAASPVHHVARVHAQVARNYRQDAEILEDYTPYHVRYLALDCQDKHNTTFFEDCCHPLLRTQKLSDRPSKCTPSASASSSAVIAEPSASVIDEDPIYTDDCDESTSSAPPAATATVVSSYISVKPTTYATTYQETSSAEPASMHHTRTTQAPATTHAPSSTKVATSAEATTSASSGGGGGDVHTGGHGTWYTQDGTTGACGIKHGDYDLIVAPDYRTYGDINSVSPLCGKQVRITNTDNGKSVTATIADVCPSCINKNSIDMSLGTFDKIGDRNTGDLPISWEFV